MTPETISRTALAAVPTTATRVKTGANAPRLITIDSQKLANLDESKQSLLQKAFTGQLTAAAACEEIAV